MKPKQDMPLPEKDHNILDNFGPHLDEKSILDEQDIKEDNNDLVKKSSDTKSHARGYLLRYTLQYELLTSKLLSSLKEVRFIK